MRTLSEAARLLGGEVSNGQVLCPGPGHSAKDRSLAVKFSDTGKPIVHSFANDDPITCLDDVRRRLGLPAFSPRSGKKSAALELDIERAVLAAANAPIRETSFQIVAAYDYADTGQGLQYQVCKLEPKDFRQRYLDSNGNWIWKKSDR